MFFIFLLILTICLLCLHGSHHWINQYKYRQWHKKLNLKTHQKLFEDLYTGVNGFKLSKAARATHDAIEYTYGEIDFLSFIALLSLVPMNKETVFYDLGSGVGKAVLACAMVYKIKKSCGLEYFKSLHETACVQVQSLHSIKDYKPCCTQICFYHGDFLNYSLDEASVIFINASTLVGENWYLLNQRLNLLTHCQYIITSTKALEANTFEVIRQTRIKVSWGYVNAFIHKKRLPA